LGADLEQEVRPAGGPAHLLLLDHPFADGLLGPVLGFVSPGAK
jgi:hypothetical protein